MTARKALKAPGFEKIHSGAKNPYEILERRGIPTTLSQEERAAFDSIGFEMKYAEGAITNKDILTKHNGSEICRSITKKGECKVEYLFENKSDAMNYARNMLGHDATRLYDESGQWIGWSGKNGKVYWNHGDWGQGLGKSTFPHLNYNINNQKGHFFIKNKIVSREQWNDFKKFFKLGD